MVHGYTYTYSLYNFNIIIRVFRAYYMRRSLFRLPRVDIIMEGSNDNN